MSNDTTANDLAPYIISSLKLMKKIHRVKLKISLLIFEAECKFGENSEEVSLLRRLFAE